MVSRYVDAMLHTVCYAFISVAQGNLKPQKLSLIT